MHTADDEWQLHDLVILRRAVHKAVDLVERQISGRQIYGDKVSDDLYKELHDYKEMYQKIKAMAAERLAKEVAYLKLNNDLRKLPDTLEVTRYELSLVHMAIASLVGNEDNDIWANKQQLEQIQDTALKLQKFIDKDKDLQ